MTLILAAHDPHNPLHLISDVVLSSPNQFAGEVWLPHHQMPERYEFGDTSISFLAQKTIIFGRTLFQWAGRQSIAQAVFRNFFKLTKGGMVDAPLSEAVRALDLLPHEASSVAYNTYFCKPSGGLSNNGYNMYTYIPSDGNEKVLVAGSGRYDFVEDFHVKVKTDLQYPLYINVLHRLAGRFIEPWLFEDKTLQMKYGGWFEVSRYNGPNFVKLPSAFKLWTKTVKGGVFSPYAPLIFSQYLGDDLILCAAYHNKQDSEANLTTAFISDPLQRSGVTRNTHHNYTLDNLAFNPSIFFHAKIDFTYHGEARVQILPFFIEGDPLVRLERTSSSLNAPWNVRYDDELISLIANAPDEDEVVVYNPWDDP